MCVCELVGLCARYCCDTIAGTHLRQTYVFPGQSERHRVVAQEECVEVGYSTMVPCQFFRRRCESLKMQRDVLRDRCAACTRTRHAPLVLS